jgi:alpha-1,2-mannosyltransferase
MHEVSTCNRRALRHAAMVFAVCGPLGWWFFYMLFRSTPGQDWMVFDTAVQAWRQGNDGLLLDGRAFTAALNQSHAAYLGVSLVFHPWVYPPYTLLLAIPFAWVSWPVSYVGFQALTAAGLCLALRPWCPSGGPGRWLMLGVLLCPATAFTLGAGQNSFFSAALAVGGISLLASRPIIAGILLGLLSFKPQLAILVPVALLAAGAWPCIAAAIVTSACLLLASLAVPGIGMWRGWLHLFLSHDPAFRIWVNEGRLHGQSVFTCLHLLGVPDRLANAGQFSAIVAAGILVWVAFRGDRPRADRLAVLLCAMILGAAHVGNYDAIMLGIAAMLVLIQGYVRPFKRGEALLAMLVWVSTAFNPPFIFHVSVVTPLFVLGLMIRICMGASARGMGSYLAGRLSPSAGRTTFSH